MKEFLKIINKKVNLDVDIEIIVAININFKMA